MRLENIELKPAGLPTNTGYPQEMVDFARDTTCQRDFWQRPIADPVQHGSVHSFERMEYQVRQLPINGEQVNLWEEVCLDSRLDSRRHRAMFYVVQGSDVPTGTLRLEYLDGRRQHDSNDADQMGFHAQYSYLQNRKLYKIGMGFTRNVSLCETRVAVFYRQTETGKHLSDAIYTSPYLGTIIVTLGRIFEVNNSSEGLVRFNDYELYLRIDEQDSKQLVSLYRHKNKLDLQPRSDGSVTITQGNLPQESPFVGGAQLDYLGKTIRVVGNSQNWTINMNYPKLTESAEEVDYSDDKFSMLLGLWIESLKYWEITPSKISFGMVTGE